MPPKIKFNSTKRQYDEHAIIQAVASIKKEMSYKDAQPYTIFQNNDSSTKISNTQVQTG